jgi:hypothetical protein
VAKVAHPKHNAAMSHGRLEGVTKPPVRGGAERGVGDASRQAGRGTRRAGRVETDEGKRRGGIERKGSIRDAPPRERRPACFIATGVAPRVSTRVPRVEVCASAQIAGRGRCIRDEMV